MQDKKTIELSEYICRSILDDEYERQNLDEDLGFEFVDQILSYTDLEKEYQRYDIIIMNSNDEYFKFDFVESTHRYIFEDVEFPIIATQVFPKTISKIIYE